MKRFTQADSGSHRAWDGVFRRAVAVKYFPAGMASQGDGAALLAAWERWMTAPHPVFLRPAVLDFQRGWLVREWVAGFSFLELLRQRHRLRAPEALRLLQAAPAALDHAAAASMLDDLGLDHFYVQCRGAEAAKAATWMTQPVEVWPEWTLRIDPLHLAQHLPKDDWKTVRGIAPGQPAAAPAVELLRGLFRELAGAGSSREETPLSAFNDAANAVLLSARGADGPTTAQQLYDALAQASEIPPPGPPSPRLPIQTPALAASALLLEPVQASGRRLRLIARPELRLGRSSSAADVAAYFPADLSGAAALSQEISRVHARLRLHEGELWLLDGDQGTPSRNGTYLHAQKIGPGAGVRFRGLAGVQLGNDWRASLLPAPFGGPAFGAREGERWGALYFLPWRGSMVLVETVWLLEEAGFGVDPEGALVWDTEALGTAPASFFVRGGEIRLVNRRLDDVPVEINGEALRPGTATALPAGTRLRIGRGAWEVHYS